VNTRYSAFVVVLAALYVSACASYTEQTKEIRRDFRGENYKSSLKKLDKSDLKTATKDRLLYLLEKAMIQDRLGESKKSRSTLMEADRLADKLYTVSISKTALSFIYNDSATDYSGEDYERVAIHTQLAMSFIGESDYKAARVEAAKINNILYSINQKYDPKEKNRYAEDAFARYLSGIIYEARGEWDDAIIDYKKAYTLYRGGYSKFVRFGMPDNLPSSLYRLYLKRNRSARAKAMEKEFPQLTKKIKKQYNSGQATGEIVVVHEAGNIAYKTTGEFFFQVGSQIIRFSYPTIKKRFNSYIGKSGFTLLANNRFVKAEHVQDMDSIARFTLEDKRGRMVAKQSARLLVKGQLAEQARQNFGPLGGLVANIVSAVTETADTRSWTLLPEVYLISRHRVKPGKHKIKLHNDGKISDFRTVNVAANKIVILRGNSK
jgi:uncharacterized protein